MSVWQTSLWNVSDVWKVCTKYLRGHNDAKTAVFDDFSGVVTVATTDTPNPKLPWCGKTTVIYIKLLLQKCAKINYKYDESRLKSYKFFILSNFGR